MAQAITDSDDTKAPEDKALVRLDAPLPGEAEVGFQSQRGFELLQRMATMFAKSDLVPKTFQGKVGDCAIALDMARRMNASPLAVMQAVYIVHGKPGWEAKFIIAAINSTQKFSPLRYRMTGKEDSDERTCVAWALEKATNEVLESPGISIGIAKKEGWYSRDGSKWKTMPELMLRYRAATMFGRLYAPEVLMGMHTADEIIDITPEAPPDNGSGNQRVLNKLQQGQSAEGKIELHPTHTPTGAPMRGAAPRTASQPEREPGDGQEDLGL